MDCRKAHDLLLEVLTGSTPPDARRALRAHLESCAACRREAALLEETTALLRSVPEPRLPEGHWAQFMTALDRRLEAGRNPSWGRVLRWLRNPVHAWSTAAATAALVVALGVTLLGRPAGQVAPAVQTPQMQAFMSAAIVDAMPAMDASLAVWKASLGAAEVSYDISGSE